jgi:hypothetical protein
MVELRDRSRLLSFFHMSVSSSISTNKAPLTGGIHLVVRETDRITSENGIHLSKLYHKIIHKMRIRKYNT